MSVCPGLTGRLFYILGPTVTERHSSSRVWLCLLDKWSRCGLVVEALGSHCVTVVRFLPSLRWFTAPRPTPVLSVQVEYKLAVIVRQCLENKAPRYLVECCTPVADVASRHRRSANLHRLTVPRYRRSTIGHRAFCLGGPLVWNSLPVKLREPTVSCGDFRRTLKTILFVRY